MSEGHRDYFRGLELRPEREAELQRLSAESLQSQREIEAADDLSFDEFLAHYFAQNKVGIQESESGAAYLPSPAPGEGWDPA